MKHSAICKSKLEYWVVQVEILIGRIATDSLNGVSH